MKTMRAVMIDSLGRIWQTWCATDDVELGSLIASALLIGDNIEVDYVAGDHVVVFSDEKIFR